MAHVRSDGAQNAVQVSVQAYCEECRHALSHDEVTMARLPAGVR